MYNHRNRQSLWNYIFDKFDDFNQLSNYLQEEYDAYKGGLA